MDSERLKSRQSFEFIFDACFGDERLRNDRLTGLHDSLAQILNQSGYSIVDDVENVDEDNVMLIGRVKTPESALEKSTRMPLRVMPDIWGLTIVSKENNMEVLAALTLLSFLDDSPIEDRVFTTPNRKTLYIPEYKDFRDPNLGRIAVLPDYKAIHMIRKASFGMVEVRVIPDGIWRRTLDPNDPLHHSNYEKRREQAKPIYEERYG